jgi:glucosamine 6-phosphate synthetase-like amidotransferase/phosphosugar isomerase protein
MCAIFGIGLLNKCKVNPSTLKDVVQALAEKAEARGRTASGVACVNRKEITVAKKNVPASQLVTLPEYKSVMNKCVCVGETENPLFSVVGHARLKTQGTELDNNNNHPIVHNSVVGTHNGMISNDTNLFEKVYGRTLKRKGKVDSEIIFALIDHFASNLNYSVAKAITLSGRTLCGSMAVAMVHKKFPYALWLFRRVNPCNILLFREVGLLAWATDENFITKAVKGKKFGPAERVPLDVDSGCGINLYQGKIYRFDFPQYLTRTDLVDCT